jgi:alpha-L-fucosidase
MGFSFVRPAEAAASPPEPRLPVPSERQLRWHDLEWYGMIHFGLNTFTDVEWGDGSVAPDVFNPSDFQADEIVRAFKTAGMKGMVLVCKHHDGFCLWPSETTDYTVKSSPWRNGKGDLVREMADACRRQNLKFGVFLSPWDRNSKSFGYREYIQIYRRQLSELLTNYGEVFIVWHDGALGGDGYYGGQREKRSVDNRTYYDWPETWALVRRLQPNAAIFSDAGPDVRWVGNEAGKAGDPCWSTINLAGAYPGMPDFQVNINGQREGTNWVPAECDVSIRPWWTSITNP